MLKIGGFYKVFRRVCGPEVQPLLPTVFISFKGGYEEGGQGNNPGVGYACAKWKGEGAGWRPQRPKRGWEGCLHILWEVGAWFCCAPDAHKSPTLVRQDVP